MNSYCEESCESIWKSGISSNFCLIINRIIDKNRSRSILSGSSRPCTPTATRTQVSASGGQRSIHWAMGALFHLFVVVAQILPRVDWNANERHSRIPLWWFRPQSRRIIRPIAFDFIYKVVHQVMNTPGKPVVPVRNESFRWPWDTEILPTFPIGIFCGLIQHKADKIWLLPGAFP